MKIIVKYTLLGGLAVAAILAVVNCKVALYPFARAFGSPPESELAGCREAFHQLQQHIGTSRVSAEPVLFVHDRSTEWRSDLAQAIAQEASARTQAKLAVAHSAPAVAHRNIGHNQMRYLWARSTDYAHWVEATHPAADYILCAEVWAHENRVEGIRVFIFDAKGQVAYCRLFNSHHFGNDLPAEGTAAIKLLVKQLFDNLTLDPATVFPPYGVG